MAQSRELTVGHMLELVKTTDIPAILKHLSILKSLGKLSELSNQIDDEGNSFLHLAVSHHDPDTVEKFHEIIGDILIEMHLLVNHKGFTALQLAGILPEHQNKKMLSLLLKNALEATKRCINDDDKPLDYYTILKKFNVLPDSKLAENLKLGCDAVNFCKKIALKSSTHPRTNTLSTSECYEISSKIYALRKRYSKTQSSFSEYIHTLQTDKYGNCAESAYLSANFAHSQKTKYDFKNFIFNDKHVFVAMNLQEGALLNNPETWGSDSRLVYARDINDSFYYRSTDLGVLSPNLYFSFGGQKDIPPDPDDWKADCVTVDCGQVKYDYSVTTTYFTNGDHVFTQLDSEENAVFADGWSFNVFPASRKENLKDYYNMTIDGRNYKFLCNYNPRYHLIDTMRTFNFPEPTVIIGDPDLLSKEMEEKKKSRDKKLVEIKDSPATSTATNKSSFQSKLAKRAIKPCLVLENKQIEFKNFTLANLCLFALRQVDKKREEKTEHNYIGLDSRNRIIKKCNVPEFSHEMLQNWFPRKGYSFFMQGHEDALYSLIHDQHLSPKTAIEQLSGLDENQAILLHRLYKDGLRNHHIQQWQPYPKLEYFTNKHTETVIYLMQEEKLTPGNAISEINQLHINEADLIQNLYKYGLRVSHLRKHWDSTKLLLINHCNEITYLIKVIGEKPELAVQKIAARHRALSENVVETTPFDDSAEEVSSTRLRYRRKA